MVPFDQPENALSMVNTWVQGDYSFGLEGNKLSEAD